MLIMLSNNNSNWRIGDWMFYSRFGTSNFTVHSSLYSFRGRFLEKRPTDKESSLPGDSLFLSCTLGLLEALRHVQPWGARRGWVGTALESQGPQVDISTGANLSGSGQTIRGHSLPSGV